MSDNVSKAAVKAVTKAAQNFEKTAGERAPATSCVFSPESGEVLWHRSMLQQQLEQHYHVTDRLLTVIQNNQSTVSASSVAIIPEKKECAFCEECETQKAALKCHDCEMLFCNSCSASIHSMGKLKEHKVHTAMCNKCMQNLATLSCEDCSLEITARIAAQLNLCIQRAHVLQSQHHQNLISESVFNLLFFY